MVELRRALLLFAIVLGLAAIATSVSRPPEREERTQSPVPSTPTAAPGPSPPVVIEFAPATRPPTERLEAGRPATVLVKVSESGQVEIEGLGLSGFAEPLTPARFDVLSEREQSHRVRFTAAGTDEARTIGTIEVGPATVAR